MVDHTRNICASTSPHLLRASIPSSNYPDIDLSLKELRSLSRRLAAVVVHHAHEQQILERVYYKGKNQHRSALFWQKVVEVRRLATRIRELDLHSMLEDLRSSFHTAEGRNNSKSLRSAWTQTPDFSTCKTILKRIQSACLLIDRARVRFRVAYQSFIVQLRTATFLPLAVSLIAITSRLDFLVAEMRSTIPSQWEAIMRVGKAIDATSNLKDHRDLRLPALPVELRPPGEEVSNHRPRKRAKLSEKALEDLGSKIVRDAEPSLAILAAEESFDVSVIQYPSSHPSTGQPFEQIKTAVSVHSPNTFSPAVSMVSGQSIAITNGNSSAPPIPLIPIDPTGKETEFQHKHEPSANVKKKKVAKKKSKTKRDEIDDIFGF